MLEVATKAEALRVNPRAVVQAGDTEAQIEAKLGPARSVLGNGSQTLLSYPEGSIILVNDHATEIPAALRTNATPAGIYTVQAGDSFGHIAKTYGVSVASLAAANPGVDPTKLKIGQKITIPSARPPTGSASGNGQN